MKQDETIPGGKYINAQGYFVNAEGQFIDANGNVVEQPVKANAPKPDAKAEK